MKEKTTTKPIQQPSISEIWQLPKPLGRYNDWGERKLITASNEEISTVDKELTNLELSPRARLLYRAAKLTKASGIDFVLFLDAQFPMPIEYKDSGMQIIPCFKPLDLYSILTTGEADASDERQNAMMKRGKFVYDGWIPVNDWSESNLERIVGSLDDFVTLFSLVGRYHAHWEPKYNLAKGAVPSHFLNPEDFLSLAKAIITLDTLPVEDRKAISRSAAWIANALKDESPIQRFLLLFVSVEAIVTFIERQSSRESPLRNFAKDKLKKSERKEKRERCISTVLASDLEPTQAIQEAYFRCVTGSKALLNEHLNRIFGNDQASKALFVEEIEGKTLWQLRNDIAHGSLNILSDSEVVYVSRRVTLLEEIARNYLRILITSLAGVNFFPETRPPMLTLPTSQVTATTGAEYMGPADMAEYYIDVEGISSSFIRIQANAETTSLQFNLNL